MWQLIFVGMHRSRPRRILQSEKSRLTLQAWSQVTSRWAYDRSSAYRANLIAFVSKMGETTSSPTSGSNLAAMYTTVQRKCIQKFSCPLSGATAISEIVCSVEFLHRCVEWEICL